MEHYEQYCNRILIKKFPEITEEHSYPNAVKYGEGASIIIYEDVFVPYILRLIGQNNSKNTKKIVQAFNLIEQLLDHEDFQVRCVAEIGFIESFLVKLKPTKDVERYLMPKSLAAARELARKWFKINPNNWEAIP